MGLQPSTRSEVQSEPLCLGFGSGGWNPLCSRIHFSTQSEVLRWFLNIHAKRYWNWFQFSKVLILLRLLKINISKTILIIEHINLINLNLFEKYTLRIIIQINYCNPKQVNRR